ncbi:MAG TPA: hypothetical protein VIL30_13305 [Ramlibacter sp.]
MGITYNLLVQGFVTDNMRDLSELNGPIEDGGEAPVLYADYSEWGYEATIVGYGLRGTLNLGEDEKFGRDGLAAAARNVIEEPYESQLTVDLDAPTDDDSDPDAVPLDLEGTPGSGDSGSPLWIETDEGWRIAGVTSSDINFARVSYNIDFIREHFADVLTGY